MVIILRLSESFPYKLLSHTSDNCRPTGEGLRQAVKTAPKGCFELVAVRIPEAAYISSEKCLRPFCITYKLMEENTPIVMSDSTMWWTIG